ncbi:hypothetical protein NUH30_02820 [Leptospira sp. 85282-16]|uniref:Uncharacterized protein n=1 Tax=Leptospira montravelensis TaxID=2484961 RepID=A0ABY2LY86_9LEPT|nr:MULTISPECIES: hypothetical protein [Leptospira]MCT8332597.1 hypothetical protein [Leptospira sp. 85282-16]TGK83810.1 hypothetical protein EHQ19_04585 [Leptospira montravelensis]TGL05815.1 hypothetical protein EHQ31_03620 [Leptospira montravelensis]
MNRSDGSLVSSSTGVFYPYQHQDFYAMDSLFLSPLKQEEVWDFQSVSQVHLGFLGFLTLRSFLRESLSLPKLQVKGLSKFWKTYLAKVNFLGKGVPWESQEFIPNLVSDSPIPALSFGGKGHWSSEFHWEKQEKETTSVFFSATNKQSEGDIAISDLMKDFLQYSQTDHYLERAYIRKENSSYLYLNSKETNPRVFFRDNPTDMPEFLFLVAELKTKSPIRPN